MSVLVMAQVFKRYPNGDGEMLLALAIADHADDEGQNIYPSIKTLAEKTRQSERTVQRHLRKMEDMGWLIPVWQNVGGRGKTSEYRISPAWLKGDNLTPFLPVDNSSKRVTFEAERVTTETERVTPVTQKGDIAVSPEPSLTINNHHSARSDVAAPQKKIPVYGEIAVRLRESGVQVTSMNPALQAMVLHNGLTLDEAMEAVEVVRTKKPAPEPIAWGYLEKVIRSQREHRSDAGLGQKPSAENGWYLNADKIAAKAWELRLVNGTVTDRKELNSREFQEMVLTAAGVTAEQWGQWEVWRSQQAAR